MISCQICKKEFDSDKQLHSHLRAHKLRMAEYYQTHFPRYDIYDNKIIKFKNKKQYLESDFNSRTNLRLWLKSITAEEAKEYCSKLLSDRKEQKELVYSPTQVELRSLTSPPMQYFNELFGWDGYYKLCSSLGYKNKHKIFNEIVAGAEYDKPEYMIFVDTREQKPLKFGKRTIQVKKLDYGDYAFSNSKVSCNCHIERKSLSDFIGTMSAGYERFNNEIKRAVEDEAYLVILVEESLSKAASFQFLPYISKKIKATPEFIFHRARSLIQKYPNIQFLFVNGRKESSRVMEKIFTSGCVYKQIDLQLAYDLKKL